MMLLKAKHHGQAMASRRRSTTTLVLASLLCLYQAPRWAFSLSFSLNFSDPTAATSILLAGDALISPPALQLTKNSSRASYRYRMPLWNGATGELASFATAFSFRVNPEKRDRDSLPQQAGYGMTFFLGHLPSLDVHRNSRSSSAGGAHLPVFADGTGESRMVAVEFDAFLNHVGIDVSSVNSTASAHTTTSWEGKNLTSSSVMEATVEYHNGSRMLAVVLLIGDALYQVNATVDLSRSLPEEVAVGFSSGNGAAFAGMHRILSWSFSSTLPESKREAPPPAEPPLPTSYNYWKIALVLLFFGTITMRCVRMGFQLEFKFNPSPGHVTLVPDWDAAFLLPP